jgi:hypothetical protein
MCRARPIFIVDDTKGQTEIEGTSITEAFQDAARFPEQRLTGLQSDEVVMQIRRGIYLPFKDLPWPDSAADTVLGTAVWFIKDQVVPRFEPFFDRRSEGSVYFATHS